MSHWHLWTASSSLRLCSGNLPSCLCRQSSQSISINSVALFSPTVTVVPSLTSSFLLPKSLQFILSSANVLVLSLDFHHPSLDFCYNCRINCRISRISSLALVHLHNNGCLPLQSLPSIWGKGWREMAILSSPPFLVCNWSGACQSPRTCQRSSSRKKGQVGSREHTMVAEHNLGWRRQTGQAQLANSSNLWTIKMVSPSLLFPLTYYSFTSYIWDSREAENTLLPGVTIIF